MGLGSSWEHPASLFPLGFFPQFGLHIHLLGAAGEQGITGITGSSVPLPAPARVLEASLGGSCQGSIWDPRNTAGWEGDSAPPVSLGLSIWRAVLASPFPRSLEKVLGSSLKAQGLIYGAELELTGATEGRDLFPGVPSVPFGAEPWHGASASIP